MKKSSNSVRIGIAVAIILGTIGWLAFTSYGANKSYYVTVPELVKMGDKAYVSNLRVEGFVEPGSIQTEGPHVTFVLNEFESHNASAPKGRKLTVVYKGQEPPPDTFKDDAQALAMGTIGRDGVFHATALQAKCASKYAPAQPGSPGQKPGMTPQKQAAPASSSRANATPDEAGKETAGIASN